jgi:RNA polymerase sigma factor (sigma-70 family)
MHQGTRAYVGPFVDIGGADDDALIVHVRNGYEEAFAELYRRHSHAALRLARHLGQREESEDVVAESFARLLELMKRGHGPDQAFRAYLFTMVRNEAGHRAKVGRRVRPTDDASVMDTPVGPDHAGVGDFERVTARAAYESLPERWRSVLWQLDVEGRKPHEIAATFDVSPNAVSALVYRARSALRDAYVQQHVNTRATGAVLHREIRSRLGAVLRGTSSSRDRARVEAHLERCDPCREVYLELAVDAAHVVA